ncbi:MAG: glutathione S-transferase family protein [Proteobacteria bacterium]|nr:glutathione S-transferase family protein [Pseudomonadota bacterium]
MYKLYHQQLCPFSRKIRFLLAAKGVEFELVEENFWERRKEFIAMNTMGTVPILFDDNSGDTICGSSVIAEYIEEKYNEYQGFLGESLVQKAETRRLQAWFDEKFFHEVSKCILNERYFNRFVSHTSPSSANLMIAKHNLDIHLKYIEFLLENKKYLAGNSISLADFSAAGHISALDYLGDINWVNYSFAKEWYSLTKSHKSFAEILKDKVPNVMPPKHYSKLDF